MAGCLFSLFRIGVCPYTNISREYVSYVKSLREGECHMNLSESQVIKLLTDPPKLSQLGFSMLIARLATLYSRNPSPDILRQCTAEINSFLDKFRSIMTSDLSIVSRL